MENREYRYTVGVKCFTFNHSRYILDAMNGFVMQQTDFPYLVMLVDDASTDGEQEVIREFVKEHFDLDDTSVAYEKETDYAFVTYAQHKINKNCFIVVYYLKENHHSQRKAKAPYLAEWRDNIKYEALCEGDDYWIHPKKLQMQVDFLEENPDYSLCGTNGWVKYWGINRKDSLFNIIKVSGEILPKDIIGHWFFPTASLLYRKDIIDNYPKWTKKIYSGDLSLILISMNKGRIWAYADCTCVYRRDVQNKNSVSMNVRNTKSRAYVITQHLTLYDEYNKYTNGRFDDIIRPLMADLRKKERVYKMMDKHVLLAALRYPVVFSSIVLNKFKKSR